MRAVPQGLSATQQRMRFDLLPDAEQELGGLTSSAGSIYFLKLLAYQLSYFVNRPCWQERVVVEILVTDSQFHVVLLDVRGNIMSVTQADSRLVANAVSLEVGNPDVRLRLSELVINDQLSVECPAALRR
jgi:hypothetical protein